MSLLRNDKWSKLFNKASLILTDIDLYMNIYKTDYKEAERAIHRMTDLKDLAARGDSGARSSIIDYYLKVILSNMVFDIDKEIKGLINFDSIYENEPQVIFEILLDNRDLGQIIDKYRIEMYLSYADLCDIIIQENSDRSIELKYKAKRERYIFIASLFYAYIYGQDCIDSLQNQGINEIGVLNKDYIYISYKGKKIRLLFMSFYDSGTIINIQKKTSQNSALNYDRQNPIVVTSKINSSRISVCGYDITPRDEDLYYNERIFNLKQITLEEMRDKYHTIDDRIYNFLSMNQKGRGSFFVTGSDMGVGKSTFLLAMLEKYSDSLGIGILDNQNELQVGLKYPNKNVITLVENKRKDLAEAFAYLLKTSRDILCVSEVTMPVEVAELVNSALRLNAGVCGTLHTYSPNELVANLRNLMLRTPMYKDKTTAQEDIAGSIDLIIHLGRLKNGLIRVMSIHEIFLEKDIYMDQDISLKELQIRALKRYLSGSSYGIRDLFLYDEDNDKWQACNCPTKRYIEKMGRYLSREEIERLLEIFEGGLS